MARWLILCGVFVAPLLVASAARAASVADELVREAQAHEAAHEDDLALRRYVDALALDPTREDAYLGLGALRLRLGDVREAEHVYDLALSHLPSLAAARLGRGRVRRALGALAEADSDLEAYVLATADGLALRELASWYAEEGRPLAQLATWRKLLVHAEGSGDGVKALEEARITVHALEIIVGPVDPVRFPPGDHPSDLRRGMARIEQRR